MQASRFGSLLEAVEHNCLVSDARHAGDNALCIFMLKMRARYRWEHGIPLTGDVPKAAVGEWMQQQEALWESLLDAPLTALPLAAGPRDPFDVAAINAELLPDGLIYSGGYGRGGKPLFFLGRLLRREQREGTPVLVAGCEYARDLEAPPGMLLEDTVFVRTEALRQYLWEKREEWQWSPCNQALGDALACYPFDATPDEALDAMTEAETETVILHELGEARVRAALGPEWEALLASVAGSRTELMLRAVRDLWADCLVTLPALLERAAPAPLHFWFANLQGYRRDFHPALVEAGRRWAESPAASRPMLVRAVAAGEAHWRRLCTELLDLATRFEMPARRSAIEATIQQGVLARLV